MEEWKKICDGKYEVSNSGRVRNVSTGRVLRPAPSKNGYFTVQLGKSVRVSRLVALAFIPNPFGLPVVNHINGNKRDNRVSNLEWVTYQQNANHALANGFGNRWWRISPEYAEEIREKVRAGVLTFAEIGFFYGVTRQTVGHIVRGLTHKSEVAA